MAFRNERLPPSSTHTDSIYYFLLASDILIASLKIYNFFFRAWVAYNSGLWSKNQEFVGFCPSMDEPHGLRRAAAFL